MNATNPDGPEENPSMANWPVTKWTMILVAAQEKDKARAQRALGEIFEYYYPFIRKICAWLVARAPYVPLESGDLAHNFINAKLEKNWLVSFVRKPNTRFRSYFVKCLSNFWINEFQKLGSGVNFMMIHQKRPEP